MLLDLTPGSLQTLTRAARDFAETNPTFALEAGVTALRWIALGRRRSLTLRREFPARFLLSGGEAV